MKRNMKLYFVLLAIAVVGVITLLIASQILHRLQKGGTAGAPMPAPQTPRGLRVIPMAMLNLCQGQRMDFELRVSHAGGLRCTDETWFASDKNSFALLDLVAKQNEADVLLIHWDDRRLEAVQYELIADNVRVPLKVTHSERTGLNQQVRNELGAVGMAADSSARTVYLVGATDVRSAQVVEIRVLGLDGVIDHVRVHAKWQPYKGLLPP